MFESRFQTFDDSSERSESAGRVERLRAELARRGLDGFVVPRADRQQNEYLPASEERLAWLTGFTGSAGAAIVLANRAVLFVDGRYTVQAAMQVDGGIFALDNLVDRPPDQWLDQNLKSGDRIGYDPWLHTVEGVERLKKACANAGASLLPVDDNPIDALWTDRPAPPSAAVVLRDVKFAGESAQRTSSSACAPSSPNCAPTLWSCPIRRTSPGRSISAAPTSRTRRWHWHLRWRRRKAARRSMSMVAGSTMRHAARWKTSPICVRRAGFPPISPRSRARRCCSTRQARPKR